MTTSSKGACPPETRLKVSGSLKKGAVERRGQISLVAALGEVCVLEHSGEARSQQRLAPSSFSARVQTCSRARHHRSRGASSQVSRRD